MNDRSLRHPIARSAGVRLAAVLALGLSSPVVAEYRLQAGDVIEISVIRLPELHQRLSVQLDGSIAIPLVGTLMVEGTSITDVRNSIQSAFASRLLTLPGPDGSELMRTVERRDVAVGIVQYRPIWVSGDVAQPGEQPFRPRMTVRKAIASAGGLRPPILPWPGPNYDPIALQDEYVARWLNLAAQVARRWRLRTELGDDSDFDAETIPSSPLPEDDLSRIINTEEKLHELRQLDYKRETQFFERAADLAEEEIASLSELLKIELQGEKDDQAEYERTQALLEQGRLINTRVIEARRAVLFSATRKLQTANDLMQARRRLSEYRRELERIGDRRRIGILEELQATELKLAEERTRLRSVAEKLRIAGTAVPGGSEPSGSAEITLIRLTAEGPRTVRAGYDDEVMPGDVVEVVWRQSGAAAPTDIQAQRPELWQNASRGD